MSVVSGYVIQYWSCCERGKDWVDWWSNKSARSEEHTRSVLKHLRERYPDLTFRLITRETTVIEHEVKE